MHAHGVQVFDGTHDNAVVCTVAHHFHFVFFPANQAFFDQQFVRGRCFQTTTANGFEFFSIVGNATTGSAQSKTGANNDRKTVAANLLGDAGLHFKRFFHGMGHTALRRIQADAGHGVLELQAVFSFFNGFFFRANQLDIVFGQHAVLGQVQRAVQGSLTTHCGQHGIGAFFLDNALNNLPGDGFDVSNIGHFRVSHDGGRVAVDQHHFIAFFAKRFTGLST